MPEPAESDVTDGRPGTCADCGGLAGAASFRIVRVKGDLTICVNCMANYAWEEQGDAASDFFVRRANLRGN